MPYERCLRLRWTLTSLQNKPLMSAPLCRLTKNTPWHARDVCLQLPHSALSGMAGRRRIQCTRTAAAAAYRARRANCARRDIAFFFWNISADLARGIFQRRCRLSTCRLDHHPIAKCYHTHHTARRAVVVESPISIPIVRSNGRGARRAWRLFVNDAWRYIQVNGHA